jgi:hypothetical protein
MKLVLSFFVLLPMVVFAADKPSMTAMWLDLFFLILVLISLKIAQFSNQAKLIIFSVYILAGIMTKTIWFPVLLWVGLYVYFNKRSDDSTF